MNEADELAIRHWVDLKKQTTVLEKIVGYRHKQKHTSTLDSLGAFFREADKHLK